MPGLRCSSHAGDSIQVEVGEVKSATHIFLLHPALIERAAVESGHSPGIARWRDDLGVAGFHLLGNGLAGAEIAHHLIHRVIRKGDHVERLLLIGRPCHRRDGAVIPPAVALAIGRELRLGGQGASGQQERCHGKGGVEGVHGGGPAGRVVAAAPVASAIRSQNFNLKRLWPSQTGS